MQRVVSSPCKYFHTTRVKNSLAAFKATRPFKLSEINPSSSAIDSLATFPFLQSEVISSYSLKEDYIAAAEDIDPSYDYMVLVWKRHESDLPNWSKAANLYNNLQQPQNVCSPFQDYIETSLMLNQLEHCSLSFY